MKVLIVAGGTGGHLFPAIRLAEAVASQQAAGDVLFVISCRKQDRDILADKGRAFRTVPVIALHARSPLAILNFTIRLLAGTIKSLFLLLRFRPSRVIGFGGYVTGPILAWACLLRIKTIIHEQNVYPGKANRILARFVDRIAVSFPETIGYLKGFEQKVVVSGNPLRRGLNRTNSRAGDTFTILAMGGSQGAHALNKIIPEAMGSMEPDRKRALEIIHIAGHREKDEVIKAYQAKGIKHSVISFTQEIDKLYNACDFVIARSGATTVSELLYLAKPSILIPYPHGNAHQRLNARVLEQAGGAVLIEENTLTAGGLRDIVLKFMDRGALAKMSEGAKARDTKDACAILLKEIQNA